MALVIDTSLLVERDRIAALEAAMSTTEVRHVLEHSMPDSPVHHRLDAWSLGQSHLLQTIGTPMRLMRGPRQIRAAAPERLAIGMLGKVSTHLQLGLDRSLQAGEIFLVDQTSAYDSHVNGDSRAFIVDYDILGLSVDQARRAIPRLGHSPLYGLMQNHFNHLFDAPDTIDGTAAAAMLGAATTELLKALVVTALDADRAVQDETLDSMLFERTKHHIALHLTEPTLNAQSIAAALDVSERRIYQVWAAHDLSLSQWIVHARLEGARQALARPGPSPAMGVLARRWGFADPSHFSRRFRSAYGLSPREWNRRSTTADGIDPNG